MATNFCRILVLIFGGFLLWNGLWHLDLHEEYTTFDAVTGFVLVVAAGWAFYEGYPEDYESGDEGDDS